MSSLPLEILIVTTDEPVDTTSTEFTEPQGGDINNADEINDPSYIVSDDNINSSKNSRSKNQVCHVCNANFARVNHLTRHMILHRNVLIHQCESCDKVSNNNYRVFESARFLKIFNKVDNPF